MKFASICEVNMLFLLFSLLVLKGFYHCWTAGHIVSFSRGLEQIKVCCPFGEDIAGLRNVAHLSVSQNGRSPLFSV